ncbi:Zn(2)-C6 fungal-type domain-containing protein [Mycena kentingensis (nom. inval.)]|nr:Zn(2)-C6 fungal-type domain-containing protein [Mycena kentingensis (nom. inval.)]
MFSSAHESSSSSSSYPQYSHIRAPYPPQSPVDAPYERPYYDYRQGMPPTSSARLPEMTRIETQYTRRDDQPLSATPVSPDSDQWPSPTAPSTKPKKSRREKPRIELAVDQPLTTQGKPRARVYVACIQCRTRKIRCDGAKPVCYNCTKRTGSNDCDYDSVPKRRGPDKNPGKYFSSRTCCRLISSGARQRNARKPGEPAVPRTRRRATATSSTDGRADSTGAPYSFPSPSSSDHTQSPEEYIMSPRDAPFLRVCPCHGLSPCPSTSGRSSLDHAVSGPQITVPYNAALSVLMGLPLEAAPSSAYITEQGPDNDHYSPTNDRYSPTTPYSHSRSTSLSIASQPSVQFSRKIWWDSLLSLYISPSAAWGGSTASERHIAAQQISDDLHFLFRASSYWFSFLHAPTFFSTFYNPEKRQQMQPSLIYSLLAISTFFQSSEIGRGHLGRARALRFRDEAQSALDASYNAGRVDDTLAQAAWMLAMFEVCAHPNHTTNRSASAMRLLDAIIRSLSLTRVDHDDPNTTIFPPNQVPEVPSQPHHVVKSMNSYYDYQPQSTLPVSTDRGCSCLSLTLKEQWPQTMEHTPLWAQTPAWSAEWSEAEIQKESCRRLCWSAMVLAAGHSNYSYTSSTPNVDLFIADPSNYALLFSGEAVVHSPASKDTIWALHDRAFLLWHACIKMRNDLAASMETKGQFALKAWHEADAIEDALNRHTCMIERAFIFQGREYLFNTRMCITYEFQRFVPLVSNSAQTLFDRNKAEAWLTHQSAVAQKLTIGLHTVTGNQQPLGQRPFYLFWLMSQVSRCLMLWETDESLLSALTVCKNLLPAIDFLTALWPCAEQRQRYEVIRSRLQSACSMARISPPPPLNLSVSQ